MIGRLNEDKLKVGDLRSKQLRLFEIAKGFNSFLVIVLSEN